MMKKCRKCGKLLSLNEFYKSRGYKDGHINYCKKCHFSRTSKYRKEHIEHYKELGEKSRKQHKARYAEYKRKQRMRDRKKAFEILCEGKPRCAMHDVWSCCGNPEDDRYLTIDHINNDGLQHRLSITNPKSKRIATSQEVYVWVKHNPLKAKTMLQVVCMNANIRKAWR